MLSVFTIYHARQSCHLKAQNPIIDNQRRQAQRTLYIPQCHTFCSPPLLQLFAIKTIELAMMLAYAVSCAPIFLPFGLFGINSLYTTLFSHHYYAGCIFESTSFKSFLADISLSHDYNNNAFVIQQALVSNFTLKLYGPIFHLDSRTVVTTSLFDGWPLVIANTSPALLVVHFFCTCLQIHSVFNNVQTFVLLAIFIW